MKIYSLENGKICCSDVSSAHFDETCDVLCIGAGSSGVYAADSAALEGASVILCELSENIGGMYICGNVTTFYHGTRGGKHELENTKCYNDKVFFCNGTHWEQKQIHITDMLHESGVDVRCRHSATGIYVEGDRVVGLHVFNGEREYSIGATIVIDATSDGHLLRMLPIAKRYGRPMDGLTVPFTVRTQYISGGRIRSDNDDSGMIDQYDQYNFSDRTIFAHANASKHLKDGEFVNVALHTGLREGLTFEGEEILSYADIIMRKIPERVLFWAFSDLDRHGYDRAIDEELFQTWWSICNLATLTVRIPVPMGAIVPKGYRGIVTAGRCLSADTYSQSAVRMNRDMFRMGECVGRACAMAVRQGVDILDIDYEEYRNCVSALGCYAGDESREFGFYDACHHYLEKMEYLGREPDARFLGKKAWDRIYTPVYFGLEKNYHLLQTDAAGPAFWSCYIYEDRAALAERLFADMQAADNDLSRYNYAVALAIIEDKRSVPVLREIVDNRDCFFYTDGCRSNQFRSAIAICLLGRLGDGSDIARLAPILEDDEYSRDMYHTLEFRYLYYPYPDRNFVYFDMLTHSMAALVKLYKRENMDLSPLCAQFSAMLERGEIVKRITDTSPGAQTYEEAVNFIKYMIFVTSGKKDREPITMGK